MQTFVIYLYIKLISLETSNMVMTSIKDNIELNKWRVGVHLRSAFS